MNQSGPNARAPNKTLQLTPRVARRRLAPRRWADGWSAYFRMRECQ
jgi:hypothetical protein